MGRSKLLSAEKFADASSCRLPSLFSVFCDDDDDDEAHENEDGYETDRGFSCGNLV